MTVKELYSMCVATSISTSKVLELFNEPSLANPSEERVYNYLRKYVCGMSFEKLCKFLRFVTGSYLITVKQIDVTFNNLF